MFKYLIGDKAFYKKIIMLSVPIMIQNGITNFVNMLDNIMVGICGTATMTGVAVANQLIFVFNLCVFGAVSGAGIFTAQFFGNRDHKGVMHTFRFKLLFCTALALVGMAIFIFAGNDLLQMYLNDETNAGAVAQSFAIGKGYLNIMLVGLIPYTLSQCFGSTLRETGKPAIPMIAGVVAVVVNLSLSHWRVEHDKVSLIAFCHAALPQFLQGVSLAANYRLCRMKNAMAETRNDLPMINFLLSRSRETQIGWRLSSDKAM